MNNDQIKQNVKKGYADILTRNTKKSFLPSFLQCCDPKEMVANVSNKIGYSDEELKSVPEDANLGIGCGNPIALASIKKGETILDLGSGAGFDCFLASRETGETGKVIGVDITPEMVEKANKNAKKGNYTNVEFKVGEIENLPIENETVDLIISNCVINLSNQKEQVFKEAFRVTKPNGRIMISDIILLSELPDYVKNSVEGHIACLSGAVKKDDYINAITKAGFTNVNIDKQTSFPIELMLTDPIAQKIISDNNLSEIEIKDIANSIASISISAKKPRNEN
ncbi:arsenite methyltransferase [Flavobacterium sp.]|uniref:arsenite methyltransferase n=1 Tax=Flavobacterium sp. TaxID=239 RepID=UPI002B4B69EA|nr:arsenite methyltransferase [Flavobacterium sp.]HLF52924.1 arsenite methyltransferase [Flavobacterium sp.]